MDRATFAVRQAEMTARWFEGVRNRVGDVDAYIAGREKAYLDRWREALRFVPDGSRLLDVGGGNMTQRLFAFLAERRLDYWYLDADPGAVAHSRSLGAAAGFEGARFSEGLNDRFDYPDASFDAVFSSHCIEHSIDLASTFAELHRIIRPGGVVTMAVPLGWEVNPEHPYFFGVDDWLAIVQDGGFQIRVWQMGCEYPERGYDLFIAARRMPERPSVMRIDPDRYRKTNLRFLEASDPSIACHGPSTPRNDGVIMQGSDWHIDVELPPGTREALPVFYRHDWSGIVELTCGSSKTAADLYSLFPWAQPVRLDVSSSSAASLHIRPIGNNPASRSSQGVLRGLLLR